MCLFVCDVVYKDLCFVFLSCFLLVFTLLRIKTNKELMCLCRFRGRPIDQVKAATGNCIRTQATCSRTDASCGDKSGLSVRGWRLNGETVALRRAVVLTSTGPRLAIPRPSLTKLHLGRTHPRSSARTNKTTPRRRSFHHPNIRFRSGQSVRQPNATLACFRRWPRWTATLRFR